MSVVTALTGLFLLAFAVIGSSRMFADADAAHARLMTAISPGLLEFASPAGRPPASTR